MSNLPFADEPDGIRFAVRVTPRAKKSEVGGVIASFDGKPALSIRLAAPPVDGSANQALIVYLAEALALPKSAITIRSGETQRLKILHLNGDNETLRKRVLRLIGTD